MIRSISSLHTLILDYNKCTDKSGVAIAQALCSPDCAEFSRLSFQYNSLGNDCAAAFMETLDAHPHVRRTGVL